MRESKIEKFENAMGFPFGKVVQLFQDGDGHFESSHVSGSVGFGRK